MSQVLFNSYIDMVNEGLTPSTIGFSVAYDLDGVLKQKDENGVITPISSDYTKTLENILRNGNYSGTYSVLMGTGSYIQNINGTGRVTVGQGNTSSVIMSVTASGVINVIGNTLDTIALSALKTNKISSLIVSSNTFSTYVGTTTYSTFIEQVGDRVYIGHYDSTIGVGGKINVIDSGKTYNNSGSVNMAYLHLNTYGASTSYGVRNSVVIGGQYLTASKSNYVYLGNWVNVNNAYTLPNTDGLSNQILTTNGGGTLSWATFSAGVTPLSKVLADGNISGTNPIIMSPGQDIILGTNSNINSLNAQGEITFDFSVDKYLLLSGSGQELTSSIRIGTFSQYVQADYYYMVVGTNSIASETQKGLVYADDYTASFVTYSLVTKDYVDNNAGSYQTHLVAYVDVNKGNNLTGQINRPTKPYQTIAAAMIGITASNYSSSDRGLLHVRKGNYTETVTLVDNVDFYCEQGVVFTQNGFIDTAAVNSNVYGNASFIGTNSNLIPLTIGFGSTVRFEFDTIDNRSSIGRIYGAAANVTIFGKQAKTLSSSGYGLYIENSADVTLNVTKHVLGAYYTIKFSDNYSGTSYIKTPYVYCDGGIGLSGYTVPDNVRAFGVGSSVTGKIHVNGNIEDLSTTFGGNYQSAAYIGSGNVTIDGNIKSLKSTGLYTTGTNAGYVSINGDIIASREAILHNNLGMQVKVRNSRISSDGLGGNTQSIFIGANNHTYIENSTIYNGLTGSDFINTNDWDSTIGLYNVSAYSPGDYGCFITTSYSDYTIGFHNVRSNKDNYDNIVDLFDPSGFIYDPYFFVPKF